VVGSWYGTPKEIWGFRRRVPGAEPVAVAKGFLKANAKLLGLTGTLGSLSNRADRPFIRSLGATHVLFQQQFRDVPIHRAWVTVHIGPGNEVYLAKNRALPKGFLPDRAHRFKIDDKRAARVARREVGVTTKTGEVLDDRTRKRWWPTAGDLRPAFRVRVRRNRPREDWIVYVDAKDESILSSYDNLTLVRGRADVFDPNPVAALRGHERLLAGGNVVEPPERAYVRRALGDLVDEPDERGNYYLDGKRVTTRLTRPPRARDADREFLYWSSERGFEEACTRPRTARRSCTSSATRCRTTSVPTSGNRWNPRRWGRDSVTTSPPASSRRRSPLPTAPRS
jgi:hypothetical protein